MTKIMTAVSIFLFIQVESLKRLREFSMKVEGVHSISLNVSNLSQSVKFYSDLLQMIPVTSSDKATFHLGTTPFILHESKKIDIPDDAKRGIGVSLHIQVANLDSY